MMTMREYISLLHARLDPVAASWGFQSEPRDIYLRPRGDIWHGFSVVPGRYGPGSFYVDVGLHLPFMHESGMFIDQVDYRAFEISYRLGVRRENGREGPDEWYRFLNEKELNREIDRMVRHFQAWALPWYERFNTLEDAVREFHWKRIEERPKNSPLGPRPPDPMGWAMYGWMLQKLGRQQEATDWLRKAYADVTAPLYMKDGRFVPEGTKGARKVRHPEAEERLEELLRQSLKLPL